MATVKRHVHKPLERFRAKPKKQNAKKADIAPRPVAKPGLAAEAKKLALQAAVASKKQSSKLVKPLESLDRAALQEALGKAREELLTLRFRHATGQLSDVRALPATKRQIARILTLIKQKEVGA